MMNAASVTEIPEVLMLFATAIAETLDNAVSCWGCENECFILHALRRILGTLKFA